LSEDCKFWFILCLNPGIQLNKSLAKQIPNPSGEDWASFQKKQRLLQTVVLYREMPVSGYFFKVLSKT